MSFDLELKGRTALVTGGTKGLGAAVVASLHDAGVKVIAVARSVPSDAPEGISYIEGDLLSAAGCTAAVNTVLEKFGGVDIIVNVLGGSSAPSGGFAVLDEQEWENALNQNLMSAVRIDRGLLPAMLVKKSGVIVHVTSIQNKLPLPESTTAYAAAKAALSTYSVSALKSAFLLTFS